jgi:hypothetical protein
MLRRLTLEKVYRILGVADRNNEMIHAGAGWEGSDWSNLQVATRLETASSCVASCAPEELPAALNVLTKEEQAELAALFYSGRDRAEFFAMLQNGRNIAGPNFGAYLGSKRRFAEHVRAGLKKLGHPARD